MMNTFAAPERTEQDRIEAYLDKVFTPPVFDADNAAARFQTLYGIPVSPDEVEHIYTCEALAAEFITNAGDNPKGSGFRRYTQCFRDVLSEMRIDMRRSLNDAVSKLENEGSTHEIAVLHTLRRCADPVALRRRVNQAGYDTCMERSARLTKRKNAVTVRWLVVATALAAFFALLICASQDKAHAHRIIYEAVYLCIMLLVAAAFTYSDNVRGISPELQAEIDRFVARSNNPDATTMQRIRWMAFKNRCPSSRKSFAISLVFGLCIVAAMSLSATSRFHDLIGFFAITGFSAASSFGRTFWANRDKATRHGTAINI